MLFFYKEKKVESVERTLKSLFIEGDWAKWHR